MAMNQFGIGFVLSAVDRASPAIGRVGKELLVLRRQAKEAATGMGSMGKMLATGVIGAGMASFGSSAIAAAKGVADFAGLFEQKMAAVTAVTRAGIEDQKKLHDTAIKAAIDTQFAPIQAAEALLTMSTMGLSANEAMKTLIPTLDLAAGALGQLTLEGAAGAVVGAVKAMGYEIGQATEVTDKLLRTTQLTNFQAKDFEVSLGRVGSTAAQFGQSLEDGLVTMGLLRNMNVDASVASTGLREAWRRLASDESSQQEVAKAGVKIFDEKTGKIRPMIDIMMDLSDATASYTDKERMAMVSRTFEVRGMLAFNAVQKASVQVMRDGEYVTLRGRDAIQYLREEVSKAEGTAAQFRATLLDTYEGQKTLAEGSRQAALTILGEAGAKLFKPFATAVYIAWTALAELMNAIPPEARQALLGVVTAIGTIVGMTGSIMVLAVAFNFLGLSVTGLIFSFAKIALFMAPLALLIAGLGLSVVALSQAWKKNVAGISDSWTNAWRQVKLGFKGVVELFSSGKLSTEMQKELGKAENEGVLRFLNKAAVWIENIKAFWDGLVRGFERGLEKLGPSLEKLRDAYGGIFDTILGKGPIASSEVDRFGAAGEVAGERVAGLGQMMIDILMALQPVIMNVTTSLQNMTAADIQNGITSLVTGMQTVWSALKGIAYFVGLVKQAFMGLFNLVQMVGAFFGEGMAIIFDTLIKPLQMAWELIKAIANAISGIWRGSEGLTDAAANLGNIKTLGAEWWNNEWFTETKSQFNDMINAFSGDDTAWRTLGFSPSGGDYAPGGESNPVAGPGSAPGARLNELLRRRADLEAQGSSVMTPEWEMDQATQQAATLGMADRINEKLVAVQQAIDRLTKKDLVARISVDDVGSAAAKSDQNEAERSYAGT